LKSINMYCVSFFGPSTLFVNEGARVLGLHFDHDRLDLIVENDFVKPSCERKFEVVANNSYPSGLVVGYVGSFRFREFEFRHVFEVL